MKKRIIFDLILLFAIFVMPWWLVAILAFCGAFLWPSYYEIIFLGLLMDVLYGSAYLFFGGMLCVLVAIVIYFTGAYARSMVR